MLDKLRKIEEETVAAYWETRHGYMVAGIYTGDYELYMRREFLLGKLIQIRKMMWANGIPYGL